MWRKIETPPDRPIAVVLFARDAMFWSGEPGAVCLHKPDDDRGERYDIGYWDGHGFYYSGSNHACFEHGVELGDEGAPTHWMPLPAPPEEVK